MASDMVRDRAEVDEYSEEQPKEPFEVGELPTLVEWMESAEKWRDLALLGVGVESMLRASDLRRLRVKDIWDGHNLKRKFVFRQQKTKQAVYPALPIDLERFVQTWIKVSGKRGDDYVFTSFHPAYRRKPLTEDAIRKKVKSWAEWLGCDPALYGAHSLRRTKPCWLYALGVEIAEISEMLGHSDIRSTKRYLGISRKKAQETALQYSMFAKNAVKKKKATATVRLSEQQLQQLAVYVAEKLAQYKID